jgi:phosphatidylglycerophosphate synthase
MRFSFTKKQGPVVLTSARVALGPLMIAGARCNWNGLTLAAMALAALLSDIYDGVLARRWHRDTAAARLYDSMADQVFYVCTGVAIWMDRREVLTNNGWLLMALLGAEVLRYVVDFVKYGKPASYHSYLAKTWGLVMASPVIVTFATERGATLMAISLALGFVCNLETLAMSVMLPVWKRDVPTLRAAWKLRSLVYCGLERNDSCA